VDDILADLRSAGGSVVTLVALRRATEYTFVHSVNVCVLSLLVGLQFGYDRTALRQLGIGALLHDVGKVFCTDLAEKPGPLTEEEWVRMKRHPWDGWDMLRRHPEVHLFSAHVALQHHERLDGSGYPRGLTADQILAFARIAAVADVYDAMTADRPYRQAFPPHEAMRALLREAGSKFDPDAVRHLAARLAVYPNGTIVRLTSGELAVVSDQGGHPDLPVVRVVADSHQDPVPPFQVALAADPRRIQAILTAWPQPFLAKLRKRPPNRDG
jgi:HD-GYP domain-containing protein (c-di-GMP phosphodiesterase class II)